MNFNKSLIYINYAIIRSWTIKVQHLKIRIVSHREKKINRFQGLGWIGNWRCASWKFEGSIALERRRREGNQDPKSHRDNELGNASIRFVSNLTSKVCRIFENRVFRTIEALKGIINFIWTEQTLWYNTLEGRKRFYD